MPLIFVSEHHNHYNKPKTKQNEKQTQTQNKAKQKKIPVGFESKSFSHLEIVLELSVPEARFCKAERSFGLYFNVRHS